jgi:hypothetical protein
VVEAAVLAAEAARMQHRQQGAQVEGPVVVASALEQCCRPEGQSQSSVQGEEEEGATVGRRPAAAATATATGGAVGAADDAALSANGSASARSSSGSVISGGGARARFIARPAPARRGEVASSVERRNGGERRAEGASASLLG